MRTEPPSSATPAVIHGPRVAPLWGIGQRHRATRPARLVEHHAN
jgi:hypothetical protein